MSKYSAPTRTNTVVYNPTNYGVTTTSTTTTGTTTSGISQDDADSRYVRLTNSQTITGQKTITQPLILSSDNTSVSLSSSSNGLEISRSINIPSGYTFKVNNQAVTTQPAGSNQQIQYNNNGAFGASNTLTYDRQTDTLFVNNVSASGDINGEDIVEIADRLDSLGNSVDGLTTSKADITYVDEKIDNLIDSAPEQLNTLNELSQALNDDANFGSVVVNSLAEKAPINNPSFTGLVQGVTKSMIGLGNVENISPANLPISSATQTALNEKQNTLTTDTSLSLQRLTCNNTEGGENILTLQQNGTDQFTVSDSGVVNTNTLSAGQLMCDNGLFVDGGGMQVNGLAVFVNGASGITKSMVGLANVDNTSDANKPISTATQSALNAKQNSLGPSTDISVRNLTSSGNISTSVNISQTGGATTSCSLSRTTINYAQTSAMFPDVKILTVQSTGSDRFVVQNNGNTNVSGTLGVGGGMTVNNTTNFNGTTSVNNNPFNVSGANVTVSNGNLLITNGTNTLTLSPTQITASSSVALQGATVNSTTSTINANTTSGTTHYPLYVSATSGSLQLQAGGGLTYTPGNGGLNATNITCSNLTVSGNMTGKDSRSVLTSANLYNYVECFSYTWVGYQNATRDTTITFPTLSNPFFQVTPVSTGNWVTAFVKSYTNSSVTVGIADVNAGQIGNNPAVFVTVYGTRQ